MCHLDEYCQCEINVYANRKVIKGILKGSTSLSGMGQGPFLLDTPHVSFCAYATLNAERTHFVFY